jgi:hypothetical protein
MQDPSDCLPLTAAARQWLDDSRISPDGAAFRTHCERIARTRGQTVIDLHIVQTVVGAWSAQKVYPLDKVEQ